jgi:hypothetical protein
VSLALLTREASLTVGAALHRLTGLWHLEDLVAHIFFVASAAALTLSVMTRVGDDITLREDSYRLIQVPLTLGVSAMMFLFVASDAIKLCHHNLLHRSSSLDLAGTTYWVVSALLLVYFCSIKFVVLCRLVGHPQHRRSALLHLAAVAAHVSLALLMLSYTAFPSWSPGVLTRLFWIAAAAGAISLVLAHRPRRGGTPTRPGVGHPDALAT